VEERDGIQYTDGRVVLRLSGGSLIHNDGRKGLEIPSKELVYMMLETCRDELLMTERPTTDVSFKFLPRK